MPTCRLRQNLQVPADGRPADPAAGASSESVSGKSQQFLRLPVESAKKLRWYDRPDLNNLIQQNLRDKNDLLGVNAALRQVCRPSHTAHLYYWHACSGYTSILLWKTHSEHLHCCQRYPPVRSTIWVCDLLQAKMELLHLHMMQCTAAAENLYQPAHTAYVSFIAQSNHMCANRV